MNEESFDPRNVSERRDEMVDEILDAQLYVDRLCDLLY